MYHLIKSFRKNKFPLGYFEQLIVTIDIDKGHQNCPASLYAQFNYTEKQYFSEYLTRLLLLCKHCLK